METEKQAKANIGCGQETTSRETSRFPKLSSNSNGRIRRVVRSSKPDHWNAHWTEREHEDDEPDEPFTRPGYMH